MPKSISKRAAFRMPVPGMESSKILDQIQENGLILRQRMVARLQVKGLQPEEIAVELFRATGDDSWTLEVVLYLIGQNGTNEERRQMLEQYEAIREEVKSPELVDIDTQIREMQALGLSVLRSLMESGDEKIRLQASRDALRLGGTDATTVEKKIVELRVDPKLEGALSALANWQKPQSRLKGLIEADVIDVG